MWLMSQIAIISDCAAEALLVACERPQVFNGASKTWWRRTGFSLVGSLECWSPNWIWPTVETPQYCQYCRLTPWRRAGCSYCWRQQMQERCLDVRSRCLTFGKSQFWHILWWTWGEVAVICSSVFTNKYCNSFYRGVSDLGAGQVVRKDACVETFYAHQLCYSLSLEQQHRRT